MILRTALFVRHDIVTVYLYVFHFQLTFLLIKLNKFLCYHHLPVFIRESASSNSTLRPGTHYLHVTWAHVMLRVREECERRFYIEFYGADWHFCHSAYVTWSHVKLWSAHVPARYPEARWHVSRPELHVRSRDVSRVTEVSICAIEFNVKSPLTFLPHA